MNAMVTAAGNTALTPTNMESAIQLAEMMARGKLVPSHLHNSPGDCLMVIEASMRWQMSPFAVAQCTSVIQGKLMFEGKLVAAALNASGILSSRLDYDFSGEGAQRAVTVRATLRGETKPREVTVFLADAKTTNSMWTKQPDQQLVYAGTRVWARRHAPEVMLGVYAPEEFDRADPHNGPTIEAEPSEREAVNTEVPLRAAAASTKKPDRVVDPTVYQTEARQGANTYPYQGEARSAANPPPQSTPPRRTVGQLLDGIEIALRDATSRVEVDRILDVEEVLKLRSSLPADHPGILRLNALRADALDRYPPLPDDDEVHIQGEELAASG